MKKFKVDKSQVLSKDAQKQVLGGFPVLNRCPSGCYNNYFDALDHPVCAVLLGNGTVCQGTIQNNQCCL